MLNLGKIPQDQILNNRPDVQEAITKAAKSIIDNLDIRQYDEALDFLSEQLENDLQQAGLGLEASYHSEVEAKLDSRRSTLRHFTKINPRSN